MPTTSPGPPRPATRWSTIPSTRKLAKLRTQVETNNVTWDVVSVTAINEATGCEEGLLEPIDWSKLLDPKDFEEVGGFGKCGVPNNFVSGGLVYDGDVIPPTRRPRPGLTSGT